ncbi:PBS lyase HEAT-like repeat domain protein [Synechococcus sp. PCC 7335]|uniref:HEAT repeat domain-containing protein n=1 Tax=Synechococcus sp. (strain ATCC 29403 / PCC 7335) TaxID=91464 RepID=UPI00017EE397|nr:HEAT repeat domain-containing protein [Synechococcus sp. PCC 7335]EDX86577.1 PBS lyase HEAT-like repeat domain protein [Synechococcus sp. PCC 7335]
MTNLNSREQPNREQASQERVKVALSETQRQTDKLIAYVNEQIELLAFDEPDPQLLRQMVQGLGDPRRSVRLRLISAFGEIGEPATPFLLDGLATHQDPMVRRACCNAMTNLGDERAVLGLAAALMQDQEMSVKSAAAGALAKIGAPAFEAVRDVLTSTEADESCKGHAAWAIATMSAEVRSQLYESLSDPSPNVRIAVVGAIAQLAQTQLAQTQLAQTQLAQTQLAQAQIDRPEQDNLLILVDALKDACADVRIEAIAHLARLNYQPAYQSLLSCLQDPEADVRKAAILALGKLNIEKPDVSKTIERIALLQKDPSLAVQRVATLVLEQLQT